MNQTLISGLTATLLMTTFSAPPPGSAEPSKAADQGSEASLKIASSHASTPALDLTSEVVKIGEQQPQTTTASDGAVIAKIHPHERRGRKVATLYVRNIPVLTFLGSTQTSSENVKLGSRESNSANDIQPATAKALDISSPAAALIGNSQDSPQPTPSGEASQADPGDPVWRASEVAAKLNQLNREGIDPKSITVSWAAQPGSKGQYVIKANQQIVAVVAADAMLPETTNDLEKDVLQATNRLRRLFGAAPLPKVDGSPRNRTVSFGSFRASGLASWYGPGFNGNQAASGEIFNQNALTAAHRSLPFGTKVRVTNMDNGLTVVVRINDRGPHAANRIIDLSAGAARVLGLIQSGVAPVRLDVIDPSTELAGN
ncbi:septal ring lytic transglycosylase RlpA family protein [Kovacikia minuta CCNUW1]|uniref:septal ring lytic transglycosylase RlpA family protein n=1 Tax=Kovacikia minuta TaxID=2931930 RepID=UPI001CCC7A4E|nr:septal ring lytic transglycosylase RlpA family protein [Kovacikia minuta]UBF23963.1 septal ring lytic transglycosylase RlpA family protein [Kovacikia minuta CCNUW1]